jgi:thiamine-phosphate diphosphorylase
LNTVRQELHFITNRHLSPRPLAEIVAEACAAGVRTIHLREKDLDGKPLYDLALTLREITSHYNTQLIINGRLDVALAVGADGVHLPESALPVPVVKKFFSKAVGRSVHSVAGAKETEAAGAAYLVFGHIFTTASKPALPQGLAALREVTSSVNIPVIAVGGITPVNAAACLKHGAAGIAVMGGIMTAKNVTVAVQTYRAILDGSAR